MTTRALVVFKHESALGNARAADLFERVTAHRKSAEAPRTFSDYEVSVRQEALPSGIEIQRLL